MPTEPAPNLARNPDDPGALDVIRRWVGTYSSALPVRRIAVVGNAPLGPSDERAALIDSSDLVVRTNSFVLDRPGEPPCLGTRTNVVVLARVARPTRSMFHDYRNRAYLVVDVGNIRHPSPPGPRRSWPPDLGSMPVPNDILGWPLRRLVLPETDGRGTVPTSGTLAAYIAYALFPEAELLLTGFSFLTDPHQTEWAHHYGTVVPVHPAHLLDREGAVLQSWIDEGRAQAIP